MKDIALELHDLLYGTGKTLATAESCTGGGIAAKVVSVSGASDYFKGGVVSYCNEIKERVLGVNPETIKKYNVVSSEVAYEMCIGTMNTIDADYGISITGCAGPGGGTAEIPVGTIWIGYGNRDEIHTYKLTEDRGREENLKNAVNVAIKLLVSFLKTKKS